MVYFAQGFEHLSGFVLKNQDNKSNWLHQSVVAGPTSPKWPWLRRLKGVV